MICSLPLFGVLVALRFLAACSMLALEIHTYMGISVPVEWLQAHLG